MIPDDRGTRRLDDAPRVASAIPAGTQARPFPTLKILLLEDEPTDAELIQRELRRAGLDFSARQVAARADFIGALETFAPDIVLADYKLPDFNGADALAHVRHVHPEIPVVMVTGALGDEGAIELLKAGARDYVLKDNLVRLPSAVERAISVEQGIRARKAAEAALLASHKLLETTERIAHVGGWEWNTITGKVTWSAEGYRIFGRDPATWHVSVDNFLAAVHADDRPLVERAIEASALRDQPFDIEMRAVRPDGSERIVHSKAELIHDDSGRVVGMTGTSHDITERKAAEAALHHSRQLVEGILNSLPVRVFWKDNNLVYLGCNTPFARDAGYSEPAELVGKDDFQMAWPKYAESYRDDDRRVIESGSPKLLFEEPLTTPAGESLTILTSKIPLRGVTGEITGVLGTYLDITDRKRAEERLAAQTAILAAEHDVSPDGILVVNQRRAIVSANQRFVDMWGIPPAVMEGGSEAEVFEWTLRNKIANPADSAARVERVLADRERHGSHEVTLTDGRVFDVRLSAMTGSDGEAHGRVWFFRDITDKIETNRALERLNRTLRTLSRGNEVLVRTGSEAELLDAMCRVIVETGGYRMAWIGVAQQDAGKSMTPVAWAGEAGDYLENARITWADEPHGCGLIGRAVRSGEPTHCQDIAADPRMAPWRDEAKKHGYASAIALPLKDKSGVFAALTIYAGETDAFDDGERKLLVELAEDLAFGIRSLREHTAHEALNQRWRASLEATIGAIASTVEMRDPYTAGHQQRVARLAVAIARELHLSEQQIEGVYLAGIVHDVGKIDIPAEILNKPGKLSRLQYQMLQGHAEAGYDILKGVDFPWPIAQMVRQHHERLDGSGYPQGLKGEAILPEARILAVADVVEAMMSHRPYRPSLGIDAALAEIEKGSGRFFDPAAVSACLRLFRQDGFVFE